MDKVKVALVGFGSMGSGHYYAYEGIEDMELIAVCDLRTGMAKEKLGERDIPVYGSLEELLANEKPDMIDLVTPSYLHAEMAVKCLEAGINVLCEKPMAIEEEDLQKMLAAAKKSGKLFMVAHVVRFMAPYRFLAEELKKEENGKLLRLDMKRISGVPTWSWENWMLDEKKSGGVGVDLSVHDIDFVQSVLGLPDEVNGTYMPVKNNSSFMLSEFRYGESIVTCEGTWYKANIPFMAEYLAVFENGYVQYKNGTLVKNQQKIELAANKMTVDLGMNISGDNAYQNEIAYFVSCVKKGEQPAFVTPDSSAESIRLVRSAMQKARIIK